ncbi:synemin [Lampris incognitus]|uniref:synemin n=1 Tax=Lampris incognitus TaxID=2546036 RepID=UPI0024B5C828|nr:synemin [Lampris incognitus]
MLQFRRSFESDQHQLQELNSRLGHYLSRTKQLEHENGCLVAQIRQLRQAPTSERQGRYRADLGELRRTVGQLSLEKSRAEMQSVQLQRELHAVQRLRREEARLWTDLGGELHGCEQEFRAACETNCALEQRLLQLEGECRSLEEAHRREVAQLRSQVDARLVPAVAQTYRGPPPATLEEIQEYARALSEGWQDTFDAYQRKVDDMERSVRADQAQLEELQRQKALHAGEFDGLRAELEKQSHMQVHLEGQLVQMQDRVRTDFDEYQTIIDQLDHERNMLADGIAEKLQERQQLLRVKMDLGMEVAYYRALLEGERIDLQEAHRRVGQHQRERIIDIKMPSQPYTPRASASTRQHLDVRYMAQTSNLRRSPVPHSGSISPSRIIPITVTGRSQHQSPASRRDMVSFSKARAAASTTTTAEKSVAEKEDQDSPTTKGAQQKVREEKKVKSEKAERASQPVVKLSPIISPTADAKSVKVVSPTMMSLSNNADEDRKNKVIEEKEDKRSVQEKDVKCKSETEPKKVPPEKKVLDSVSVENIIDKVMKPAGLDVRAIPSGESKITYHVEKTEQEDGSTKTQIVLESKVEEELDISEDSAFDDLLSRGVKKVSLEDIKGTPTGSMIQNLLSGLQGTEDLANKSVHVEIIEEPVEAHSDEEYEVDQKSMSSFFQPSSTYFQIEELENIPHESKDQRSNDDDALKTFGADKGNDKGGSVQFQQVSKEGEPPYFSHDQESQEYFVSTPDDNLSESEEGGGITSYGHYGIVDDLSDEKYYTDEGLPSNRLITEERDEFTFMSSDEPSLVKDSFPECIIEEEVHVSPTVQESVLEFLKEDTLDPKEQLKGALEKIQGSVSDQLKEELAFISRVGSESPENLAVDVKKVQQSNGSGTMTIVAELNVSQTLEDSGLLEAEGDELSEEDVMAALRSYNPELEKALQGAAEGGYSLKVSREPEDANSEVPEGFTTKEESMTDIAEKYIRLGPSEKSFTFQMGVNNSQAQPSSDQVLQSQIVAAPLEISHEKRVATVYLENPNDD